MSIRWQTAQEDFIRSGCTDINGIFLTYIIPINKGGIKMGEKKGFFSRLVSGLTKTRKNIASGLDAIFSGFSKIDDEFYEELEEILIMGDLGVDTTMNIIENLQERVKEERDQRAGGVSSASY